MKDVKEMMKKPVEVDIVKVGTGTKTHKLVRGTSTTHCGLWVGSHGMYKVDSKECTCKKCSAPKRKK